MEACVWLWYVGAQCCQCSSDSLSLCLKYRGSFCCLKAVQVKIINLHFHSVLSQNLLLHGLVPSVPFAFIFIKYWGSLGFMACAFCHLQWKSAQWSKVLSELALTVISYFTASACFVAWIYFWCKCTPTQKGKNEQKRNPDKTTTHLKANNKRITEKLARFSKYFELFFFFFFFFNLGRSL